MQPQTQAVEPNTRDAHLIIVLPQRAAAAEAGNVQDDDRAHAVRQLASPPPALRVQQLQLDLHARVCRSLLRVLLVCIPWTTR